MYVSVRAALVATVLLGFSLCANSASAQLLGTMSTASVEEVGAQKVGGFVGITGKYVSLEGQYRYGIASSLDLGVKAGYVDFESPGGSSLALNGNMKFQLLDIFLRDPVDLSVGPEVTYFRANDITNWYFGGFVVASKEFDLKGGKPLAPYARLGFRLHRADAGGIRSDTFDIGIAGGVEYGISGYTSLYGEVVIEDLGTGLYIGGQYQLP